MKDRFVLPTFQSEYSDLLQGEDVQLYIQAIMQTMWGEGLMTHLHMVYIALGNISDKR